MELSQYLFVSQILIHKYVTYNEMSTKDVDYAKWIYSEYLSRWNKQYSNITDFFQCEVLHLQDNLDSIACSLAVFSKEADLQKNTYVKQTGNEFDYYTIISEQISSFEGAVVFFNEQERYHLIQQFLTHGISIPKKIELESTTLLDLYRSSINNYHVFVRRYNIVDPGSTQFFTIKDLTHFYLEGKKQLLIDILSNQIECIAIAFKKYYQKLK